MLLIQQQEPGMKVSGTAGLLQVIAFTVYRPSLL
jgi:hypothetical protein